MNYYKYAYVLCVLLYPFWKVKSCTVLVPSFSKKAVKISRIYSSSAIFKLLSLSDVDGTCLVTVRTV